MVHRLRHAASAAAAGAVAGLVMACGSASSPHAVQARPAAAKATATAVAKSVRYDLYTHCGIDEARIGNRYFEADHPLSDGSGNPPPGWGNPYQAGPAPANEASTPGA